MSLENNESETSKLGKKIGGLFGFLAGKAKEGIEAVSAKIEEAKQDPKGTYNSLKDKASEAFETARSEVKEAIKDPKAAREKITAKVEDAIESGAKAINDLTDNKPKSGGNSPSNS